MANIVYTLVDPVTKIMHYVGYTSNQKNRLRRHCLGNEGTKEKQIWIRHLKKQGLNPIMEIIKEYNTSEELPAAEEYWYVFFISNGAELYNDPFYIGNKSGKNRIVSEETIKKLSKSHNGQTSWNKGKRGQISTRKDFKHTEEGKKKISESNKGKKRTEEQKHKISIALKGKNKGKKRTDEVKQKLSESHMGHKHTEEQKRKIGISNSIRHKDIPLSEEHKKALSKAGKGMRKSPKSEFKKGIPAPNKGRKRIIDENGKIRYVKVES